jgi:retinol dehydrogenase 12
MMHKAKQMNALVTGGTDGIGKEVARSLLAQGFAVIIVGRDPRKGAAALAELQAAGGAGQVQLVLADLSLMANAAKLAATVRERFPHLDALVHSAGVILTKRVITSEKLELTWAIDYLSRYVLTTQLLPLLDRAAQARVVFIAASGSPGTINFTDLLTEQRIGALRGLGQAQFANDVLAHELARRHASSRINFYALHPGAVETSIRRALPRWLNGMLGLLFRGHVLSARQGAEAPLRLLLDPALAPLRSGLFKQHAALAPTAAANPETGRRLWEVSELLAQRVVVEGYSHEKRSGTGDRRDGLSWGEGR